MRILQIIAESYMPNELVESSKKRVFNLLYEWLHNDLPDRIRIPIVDLIFAFITD